MSDKYAALRAAAEKATPGEWVMSNEYYLRIRDSEQNIIASAGYANERQEMMDATFIAAASPATILELLAERDADKRRIAELGLLRDKVSDPRVLPRRKEFIGGQQYSYVLLENVTAMVDEACAEAGISLKIEGE